MKNHHPNLGQCIAAVLFALSAAASGHASAKDVDATFDVGAAIKSTARVSIPGGKARMTFNTEGAGKLIVDGREEPVFVACDGTDVLLGAAKVVDGFAECEIRTLKSGDLYIRFQKIFEADGTWNQLATFTITGGTGEMAKLSGTLAAKVEMSPPLSGGKLVFGVSSKGRLTQK
ncbi:MAG TPA: hypothetical protein VLJ19_00395 [Variovorax sp.]|nr:hypothetical protein [Variovorax sp.]